jgi:hypothetical protein
VLGKRDGDKENPLHSCYTLVFLESLAQSVERVKQSLFVDLVDMVFLASGNFVDAFQKEANHCIERFCVDYAVQ